MSSLGETFFAFGAGEELASVCWGGDGGIFWGGAGGGRSGSGPGFSSGWQGVRGSSSRSFSMTTLISLTLLCRARRCAGSMSLRKGQGRFHSLGALTQNLMTITIKFLHTTRKRAEEIGEVYRC